MRTNVHVGAGFTFETFEQRMLLTAALPNAGAASMAYDAGGVLHVAYYDAVAMNLRYATRAANGTWSSVVTVDAAAGVGSQLSIALDGQGRPGVAYYDAAHKDLKYAHFDGTAWAVRGVDVNGRVGRNPSLTYDGVNPLISYYAQTGGDLRLASFNGRKWHTATIDAAGNAGRFSSVAINPVDGGWAIAYEGADDHTVRFAARSRRRIYTSVIESLPNTAGWASKPSLAFDGSDRAAVSYADPANDDVILARIGRRRWSPAVAVSNGNVGTDNTLTFDNAGHPLIVYADQSGVVNLAANDGTSWGVAGLGGGDCATAAINPVTHTIAFLDGQGGAGQADPNLDPPSDLTAGAVGTSRVDLSWTDASGGTSGFVVQRSVNGGAFANLATVGAGVTAYSDMTVSGAGTYAYRVCATDAGVSSVFCDAASVVIAPTTPDGVAATGLTAAISFDDIRDIALTWADHAEGEAGYRVERSSDGVDYVGIAVLPADVTDFEDATVAADHLYAYRVVTIKAGGADGQTSAGVVARSLVAAPTQFHATATSASQVDLSWTNVTTSADHYVLNVAFGGVNAQYAGQIAVDATHYVVTQLPDGTPIAAGETYAFWLTAVRSDCNYGTPSSAATTGFAAPEDLFGDTTVQTALHLAWSDVLGASGYELEAATNGVNFTPVATTGVGENEYTVTGLAEETTYTFRVRALGSGDAQSAWSSVASEPTPPAAPTGVVATALPGGHVRIDWVDASEAETGYVIEVAVGASVWYVPVTVAAGTTTYDLTDGPYGTLTPGVRYRFSVRAIDDQLASDRVDSGLVTALGPAVS